MQLKFKDSAVDNDENVTQKTTTEKNKETAWKLTELWLGFLVVCFVIVFSVFLVYIYMKWVSS